MSFMLGTRRNLTNLGAIPILVKLLSDRSLDLQILSAETLANVAKIRKGRKFIRKAGGIKLMVNKNKHFYLYSYTLIIINIDMAIGELYGCTVSSFKNGT